VDNKRIFVVDEDEIIRAAIQSCSMTRMKHMSREPRMGLRKGAGLAARSGILAEALVRKHGLKC